MGLREDLYNVHVIIAGSDGKKIGFDFDTFEGGEVSAKETKYRPANGTVDQLSLGGAQEVSNVTCTAIMTYAMYQQVPWMLQQVGKATVYVNKQPLDQNGAAFGKPLAYHGSLQAVMPPKTSSESDAPGMLHIVQSSVTPINAG
jgi:hypothetical protein